MTLTRPNLAALSKAKAAIRSPSALPAGVVHSGMITSIASPLGWNGRAPGRTPPISRISGAGADHAFGQDGVHLQALLGADAGERPGQPGALRAG